MIILSQIIARCITKFILDADDRVKWFVNGVLLTLGLTLVVVGGSI